MAGGCCKDIDLVLEDKRGDGDDAAKNVGRHDEERNAEVAQFGQLRSRALLRSASRSTFRKCEWHSVCVMTSGLSVLRMANGQFSMFVTTVFCARCHVLPAIF